MTTATSVDSVKVGPTASQLSVRTPIDTVELSVPTAKGVELAALESAVSRPQSTLF